MCIRDRSCSHGVFAARALRRAGAPEHAQVGPARGHSGRPQPRLCPRRRGGVLVPPRCHVDP
eukprot:591427-Alexandrium_andersonii.AAC.1